MTNSLHPSFHEVGDENMEKQWLVTQFILFNRMSDEQDKKAIDDSNHFLGRTSGEEKEGRCFSVCFTRWRMKRRGKNTFFCPFQEVENEEGEKT